MKRRILSIVTALALCLGLCPAWAFAAEAEAGDSGSNDPYQMEADSVPVPLAEGDEPDGSAANPWPCGADGDNVTATLVGGTLTISGTGAMADYDKPESRPWHNSSNTITTVVLKSGVTTVGGYAFENNSVLTTVIIPDTVASIGNFAFSGTNLQSVTIPGSVTEIGMNAFAHTHLASVTIPSGVKTVGNNAFLSCTLLEEVTFQGRETAVLGLAVWGTVQYTAFDGCDKLTAIQVPHGAEEHYSSQEGIPSNINITAPEDHTYDMVVSNDDGTHSKKCLYCDATGETVSCTYGLKAAADGSTVTVRKECEACGYSEELGKAVFTFENLTYMDPEAKVSWTKTGPELLGVAVKIDNAGNCVMQGDAKEISCNLMGSDPDAGTPVKAGAHTLKVLFYDDDSRQESNECALPFTVSPAPLSGTPSFGSGEGKTLGEVEVTLPEGWPEDGTFAWADGNDAQVVQGASYAYTFTSADGNSAASGSVVLWEPPEQVDPDPGPDEPDPGPDEPERVETKVEVEEGVSEVPEGLKGIPELDTPAKLETAMRAKVTQTGIPAQNTAVYDVTLLVSTDGGQTWTPATKDNFPADGRLTVTLPYPEGTDSTYTFTVVHMFTTPDFGKTPGGIETPAVTNTEGGIRFTVTGLSPVSVGWTKDAEPPAPPVAPGRPVTPSRPSGVWSGVSAYAVTVSKTTHGKVVSSRANASNGSTVTLTVTPDSGYALDTLTVTDSWGDVLQLTAQGGGKYTFTMPGRAVTVKAAFAPLPDGTEKPCDGGVNCPSRAFTDLGDVGTWYHEAVDYVIRSGLMNGYSNGTFGPNDNLSRAQLAQILFNKEGRPVVNYLMRYSDVAAGAWYAEAIRWATSQGIVNGCGNGMFGPDDNITREQLATMLWRYAGSPTATDRELHFADAYKASDWALEALRWATEKGILGGKGNGILDPTGQATRAETAQMLKNFMERR